MNFATAANVIPLLVSAAPAAPKGLAHTAIIHPRLLGPFVRSSALIQSMSLYSAEVSGMGARCETSRHR